MHCFVENGIIKGLAMTAHQFLKQLRDEWKCVPSVSRTYPSSNSELSRMLEQGAVVINGERPKPQDELEFPITEMYFFPRGKRVTLMSQ